jgi:hypothetical protein
MDVGPRVLFTVDSCTDRGNPGERDSSSSYGVFVE